MQRVCGFRVSADRLRELNASLRGSRVEGFKYERKELGLGELRGDEFVIVLRDASVPGEEGLNMKERIERVREMVSDAVRGLRKKGFVNYYGLQRFGSFTTGTDEVGHALLKGDFRLAVDLILHQDEIYRSCAAGEGREFDCRE